MGIIKKPIETDDFSDDKEEPTITKEECIAIALTIKDPQTRDERYTLHLAQEHFRENIFSFTKEELTTLLNLEHFTHRLGDRFPQIVMRLCIEKNQSFPIVFKEWGGKKISESFVKSYIKILHEENNEEQLNFFLKKQPHAMSKVFSEISNPSPLLIEWELKRSPGAIFKINWSDEDICNWMNSNKHHTKALARFSKSYINQLSKKVKETLYENIVEVLSKEKEDVSFIKYVANQMDYGYFTYAQKHHEKEFYTYLATNIVEDHPKINLNVAQYMVLNRNYESSSIVNSLFMPYKELLLKPLCQTTRLYDKKTSLFEYSLSQSNFTAFSLFNLNDELSHENKEIMIAASFCLLQHKYGVFDNSDTGYDITIDGYEEILKPWYPTIIYHTTDEQFSHYAEKVLASTTTDDLIKEINQIKLYKKLNVELKDNETNTKKPKI